MPPAPIIEASEAPAQWDAWGVPFGFYKNLGWQYVGTILTVVNGFLYSVFIGRALGSRDFGLLTVGLSSVSFVFLMVELRLHEAVIQYVTRFWSQNDPVRTLATIKLAFLADVCTGLIGLLAVIGLSPILNTYLLRDPRHAVVLFLSACTVFTANVANATSIGVLRVFGDFKTHSIVTGLGTTSKTVICLSGISVFGWGVYGVLVGGVIATTITSTALACAAIWRLNRRIPILSISAPISSLKPWFPEMWTFVRSLYLISITGVPMKELDVNLLGLLAGLDTTGKYKIAKTFMSGIWALSDPTLYVVYPTLAKLWSQGDWLKIRAFVRNLTVLLGFGGLAVVVGGYIGVPLVMRQLMGPQFQEAGGIFHAMLWPALIWFPLQWLNPLLMAAGRPDLILKAAVLESVIVSGLYFVGIAWLGATGAAIVNGLASPLVLLFAYVFARQAGIDILRFASHIDPAGETE